MKRINWTEKNFNLRYLYGTQLACLVLGIIIGYSVAVKRESVLRIEAMEAVMESKRLNKISLGTFAEMRAERGTIFRKAFFIGANYALLHRNYMTKDFDRLQTIMRNHATADSLAYFK